MFDDNDDAFLNFTDIPVMSHDGLYSSEGGGGEVGANRNVTGNELKEDEHEDMVLDRGNEYKMVSIMRQGHRKIVSNPYEEQEKQLEKIEEENAVIGNAEGKKKWTAALPKFGGNEEEETKEVSKPADDMSFDDTADIKV
jgi:hypothetical protein